MTRKPRSTHTAGAFASLLAFLHGRLPLDLHRRLAHIIRLVLFRLDPVLLSSKPPGGELPAEGFRAAAAPGEAGKLRVELCFVDGLGLGGFSHGGLRTDHTKGDFPHAGLVAGKGFGLCLKRGA